jgi:YggT family protein
MSSGASFWLFDIPNFILAAAFYTLIGRYVLSVFFKPDSDKVFWRVFVQVTDPMLRFVRASTPLVVPNGLVMVLALFWIILLRLLLLLVAAVSGFLPSLGGVT